MCGGVVRPADELANTALALSHYQSTTGGQCGSAVAWVGGFFVV